MTRQVETPQRRIRPFTTADVFTFVDLLASVSGTLGDSLRGLLRSGGGSDVTEEEAEDRGVELILLVLNKAYAGAKDKLVTWFASLLDMSVDEFLSQPPETFLDVIEEIVSRKESVSFFKRAFALFKGKESS
jgi:hypothetical protein